MIRAVSARRRQPHLSTHAAGAPHPPASLPPSEQSVARHTQSHWLRASARSRLHVGPRAGCRAAWLCTTTTPRPSHLLFEPRALEGRHLIQRSEILHDGKRGVGGHIAGLMIDRIRPLAALAPHFKGRPARFQITAHLEAGVRPGQFGPIGLPERGESFREQPHCLGIRNERIFVIRNLDRANHGGDVKRISHVGQIAQAP